MDGKRPGPQDPGTAITNFKLESRIKSCLKHRVFS